MRLALRFLLAAIVPVSLIILGNGYLRLKREIRLLTEEVAIHQRAMGLALSAGVEQVWRTAGDEAAEALMEAAGQREKLIHLDWRPTDTWTDLEPGVVTKLQRDEVFVQGVARGDGGLRSLVPVTVDGEVAGAIEMTERLQREDTYLSGTVVRVLANTLAAAVAVSMVMILVGWLFVARRVDALVRLVRRMGDDTADDPAEDDRVSAGSDELGMLAREMRATHARLIDARSRLRAETERRIRTTEQLRHADRLSTVGQLASGMAHELGTPLNVALGRARMLQERAEGGKEAAYLDVIIRQIERMSGIVRQVLDFSRRSTPHTRDTDLLALAQEQVRLIKPLGKQKEVSLLVEGESIHAHVDKVQIDQVLTNLIMNAIHASEAGAEVRIRTTSQPRDEPGADPGAGCAVIEVQDTGAGMPPEVVERVFDPFFTTKDIGEGTGLGLSVAHGIVLDHGGHIEVHSAPGEGSTFTVKLPRERPPQGEA